MTLAITVLVAVAFTLVWYLRRDNDLCLGLPCLMFWGASLMWLVDAVAEYLQEGVAIFQPSGEQLSNDAFLGVCVVALGLVIWVVTLLVKDPRGRVRAAPRRHLNCLPFLGQVSKVREMGGSSISSPGPSS